MVVWGEFTNSWGKKRAKGKGEREWYIPLSAEFQRLVRRDKKVFVSEQCKEIEEGLEVSSRKLEISREHFMQGWAQ